mmetsp:Transcript_24289/g.35733  ORF Transcript_24289/g.35733 Transcript_24289/m.35733 type:complete len:81 (+) Transcript_24289:91-333(+)
MYFLITSNVGGILFRATLSQKIHDCKAFLVYPALAAYRLWVPLPLEPHFVAVGVVGHPPGVVVMADRAFSLVQQRALYRS